MTHDDLSALLDDLIATWENEVIEFKRGKKEFSLSDIGQYFSALSNEANLRDCAFAWLIFGVDDKTRTVVGTDYKEGDSPRIQAVSNQVLQNISPKITFRNIYELQHRDGKVILFQIPQAPQGTPVAWQGHYYARAGESLVALGQDKINQIHAQEKTIDWSAQVVAQAKLSHLDPAAIQKARDAFVKKMQSSTRFDMDEFNRLSDEAFLNKARLLVDGQITKGTLLLLGKAESFYLLTPHPASMTWSLETSERAYEHFLPPFFLTSSELYQKIRNFQMRILPDDELIPVEIAKYDQRMVLEALHNCIAHQDYTQNAKIIVAEKSNQLVLENMGSFFEGEPMDYVNHQIRPKRYRNPFLVNAMVQLNMIDSMGYGIYDMHQSQAKRYLPLPDYDLSKPDTVKLTIYGGVIDPAFSKLLIKKTDLSLQEIMALDRVQKRQTITKTMASELKRKKLIEGRRPNYQVAYQVAEATGEKVSYIRNRKQADEHYMKLMVDLIDNAGYATREEINSLIIPLLSNHLDDRQKISKVGNLLTKMRKLNLIKKIGTTKSAKWQKL
ncbi:MAG: RNA-binding domain-containing protein [Moraxella sp.]|jgi:ATP-dependent DNA helicase RecG